MTLNELRQALPQIQLTRRPSAASQPSAPALPGFDMVELTPLPAAHLQPPHSHGRLAVRAAEAFPLMSAPARHTPHDSRAFRHRVGEVQLQLAHAAYRDTPGAMLLSARASPNADLGTLKEARMATNAGHALVRLTPQGLITMGLTQDIQCASKVLSALRQANITDGHHQVSRGDHRDVSTTEVDRALTGLQLTNRQRLMVQDIVVVAKFLYDFGIREARNAFNLELCCGANTFARSSSWREWGLFLKDLFDPEASSEHNKRLQARLIELGRPA